MKRMLALMLSCVLALTACAGKTEQMSKEEQTKRLQVLMEKAKVERGLFGFVLEVQDEVVQLLVLGHYEGGKADLEVASLYELRTLEPKLSVEPGQYVLLSYDGTSTRSLPPQIVAERCEVVEAKALGYEERQVHLPMEFAEQWKAFLPNLVWTELPLSSDGEELKDRPEATGYVLMGQNEQALNEVAKKILAQNSKAWVLKLK